MEIRVEGMNIIMPVKRETIKRVQEYGKYRASGVLTGGKMQDLVGHTAEERYEFDMAILYLSTAWLDEHPKEEPKCQKKSS